MAEKSETHAERLRRIRGRSGSDRQYDRKRKLDPLLARAQKLRSSSRWQRVRLTVLKRDKYLCVDPFGYHKEDNVCQAAHEVDHIIQLIKRFDLAFNQSNLASLCHGCHAKKSAMERTGKPTKHLFKEVGTDNDPDFYFH